MAVACHHLLQAGGQLVGHRAWHLDGLDAQGQSRGLGLADPDGKRPVAGPLLEQRDMRLPGGISTFPATNLRNERFYPDRRVVVLGHGWYLLWCRAHGERAFEGCPGLVQASLDCAHRDIELGGDLAVCEALPVEEQHGRALSGR